MQFHGFLLILCSAIICQVGTWWPDISTPGTSQPAGTVSRFTFEQATPKSVDPHTVEAATEADLPPTLNRAFENGQPLVARVNQQPLLLEIYQQRLAQFEQTRPEAEDQQPVLMAMLDELIVAQYAATMGITVTRHELETALANESSMQLESWLAENQLSYQQFMAQLGQQMVANQVFEHVTRDVPQNLAQVQAGYLYLNAEDATRFVDAQGNLESLFEELSRKSLVKPTSPLANGALVWLPQQSGLLPQEVEVAAFSMQPGQISKPVQAAAGFYIVKVVAAEVTRPLTADMLQIVKKEMFIDWLQEQRLKADIEVYITH